MTEIPPASSPAIRSTPLDHPRSSMLTAALESLRPYQWLKNALVFVPLAAAHELGHIDLLMAAARSFVAFCLCASSVYLINDVRDAALDRLHPHKRHRPIAAGRLPRSTALALVPFLLAGAMIIIWPLGIWTTAALAFYFALMVAYSLYLKSVALLDALVLAGGYALRVITGGLAVAIRPSPRLLAFCIFLFFSLALVKRYAELSLLRLQNPPPVHVRGYLAEDRGFILALGTSCGALSALVLAVYMASENVARIYARSEFIWLTCVLLLYWISHVWLSAHRGRMPDDPLVFALKDPTSIVLVLLMGATAWLAV